MTSPPAARRGGRQAYIAAEARKKAERAAEEAALPTEGWPVQHSWAASEWRLGTAEAAIAAARPKAWARAPAPAPRTPLVESEARRKARRRAEAGAQAHALRERAEAFIADLYHGLAVSGPRRVVKISQVKRINLSVLLLSPSLPDCTQNQTAVSNTIRLLSDF